MIFQIQL